MIPFPSRHRARLPHRSILAVGLLALLTLTLPTACGTDKVTTLVKDPASTYTFRRLDTLVHVFEAVVQTARGCRYHEGLLEGERVKADIDQVAGVASVTITSEGMMGGYKGLVEMRQIGREVIVTVYTAYKDLDSLGLLVESWAMGAEDCA